MRKLLIAAIFLGASAFAQSCVAERVSCNQGGVAYNTIPMAQLPTGVVAFPSGAIILTLQSACPSGFTEVTALSGKFVLGTVAANSDAGTTGGNATITPAGTNTAPVFTGTSNQTTSSTSGGTPAGTNSTVSFTPAGTNGTAATGATSGGTPAGTISAISATATAALTSAASAGQNTANNTHTHPAPTFTGSALGTHTHTVPAETFTGSAGTIPAETFTGSALTGHTHTLTPAGTNSAPAFTGTPIDPSPPWVKVLFCSKN